MEYDVFWRHNVITSYNKLQICIFFKNHKREYLQHEKKKSLNNSTNFKVEE